MNKSQLVDKIAEGADISKAAAGRALDAIIASVTESLQSGDSVALVGFGTLTCANVQHVLAVTLRQVKKSAFLLPKYLASVLARH